MAPQTPEEDIQERLLQLQHRLYSGCSKKQQYPPKRQQRQIRRWRLQLPSYVFSRRNLLRPRHQDPPLRRQNQGHPKAKRKEDNKTINSSKTKGEYLECSMTMMTSMRCKEEQEEGFDHDKQHLQENGGVFENSGAKEGTRPLIDNIAIPSHHCSDSTSNSSRTTTPTSFKQACAIDSTFDRFEVLERLGYGSSGSSVFKAIDRWDNFRAVAIKKIPLTALTDSISLSKDNEVPQEEIDYFVSWIVDHYGDRNTSFVNPSHEEYTIAFNNNDNGSNGNGSDDNDNARPSVNYGPNENPHVQQRRSSFTKENPKGLNQVVKSLGFHRNDAELWIALELCAGGSVADLIRLSDGPMTESEIGWIMSQILLGLAYLHSKDHVHGDIKASNILLTLDGHVKLGGSGAIMSHKEGAGERKRRRRSLTMTEFPASWIAPESDLSTLPRPTPPSDSHSDSTLLLGGDGMNDMQHYRLSHAMPGASTEVDVWALGVACIEMSQGRPPRPETPILVSYGDRRYTTALGNIASIADEMSPTASKPSGGYLLSEASEAVGMGMSEEMWMFIRKCLTPDPEARPTVQDLLQDPFIVQHHDEMSQELLLRIGNMVDFVGQCASISEGQTLDSARSDNEIYDSSAIQLSTPTSSVTLSPSKASHMIDFKTDETDWFIPRVRPRVNSVYDESSFFDEAGVQRPIGPLESVGSVESMHSGMDWKHQRVSHPKVMQALMCDQPRYLTFRHSRSPSLATIVEDQMEEDAFFWSDDEGDSDGDDDDSDNDGHDNDNAISAYLSQQYNQESMYTSFQESQSQSQQRQQQPWTPEHDKGGIDAFDHTPSNVANGAYLDRIAIEANSGLRSIVEYDFHGASSRLVVMYEIHESWLH